MKNTSKVDFSLFQFDRDLTFAAFFMNSDKTIYGRFGTRTQNSKHQNVLCAIEESPYSFLDSDVTLAAFEKTVTAALDIHREYSVGNETLKTSLAAKRGPRLNWNSSNTLPTLQTWRKRTDKLSYSSVNANDCIHCHQFATGRLESLRQAKLPIPNSLIWSYPMPDLLGLILDRRERAEIEMVRVGSEAERAGFRIGDEILSMNNQPIISIADVQWVLHQSSSPGDIPVEIDRSGQLIEMRLALPSRWKRRGQISWRVSMARLEIDVLGLLVEGVSPENRRGYGLTNDGLALEVVSFPPRQLLSDGQTAMNRDAQRCGIQIGDLIIEIDGNRKALSRGEFIAYCVQSKQTGDRIQLKVLRAGEELSYSYRLGTASSLE